MNPGELKRLQTRAKELRADLKIESVKRSESARACSKLEGQINAIQADIDSFSVKEIIVSEHAILRYIERVMGMDIERIKQEITENESFAMSSASGLSSFKIKTKGNTIVVKDRVVVTVN